MYTANEYGACTSRGHPRHGPRRVRHACEPPTGQGSKSPVPGSVTWSWDASRDAGCWAIQYMCHPKILRRCLCPGRRGRSISSELRFGYDLRLSYVEAPAIHNNYPLGHSAQKLTWGKAKCVPLIMMVGIDFVPPRAGHLCCYGSGEHKGRFKHLPHLRPTPLPTPDMTGVKIWC